MKILKPLVIIIAFMFILSGMTMAGNLEPSLSPGSTMHTLEEIYNKINSIPTACNKAYVPKTGQTTSYSDGDDGDLEVGYKWPTPRFATDSTDTIITDNLTGLMWLKNANKIKSSCPNFDDDGTAGDGAVTWQSALNFMQNMNSENGPCNNGEYKDWRLPNRRELISLIDDGQENPPLPSGHPFSNVQDEFYWSGTTSATGPPNDAWGVRMDTGEVIYEQKTGTFYVWPVRNGN